MKVCIPIGIQKEKISVLCFPHEEVLIEKSKQGMRYGALHQALVYGNNFRYKVKIMFEDDESLKVVETTIWAVTEKMVVLKGGIVIPIHRVHSVAYS